MKKLLLLITVLMTALSARAGGSGGLLKVSSTIVDKSNGESVRVKGVGSLISAPLGRYFVLTAGHVAAGTGLKIQSPTGADLRIVHTAYDNVSDLALIEVAKDSLTAEVSPLGRYTYRRASRDFRIETNTAALEMDPLSYEFQSIDSRGKINFRFAPIESADAYAKYGESSGFAIPSWLNLSSDFASSPFQASGSILSRNSTNSISGNYAFSRGFSGAPLLVSYRPLYSKMVFDLEGVLTISAPDSKTWSARGKLAVQRLFFRALGWSLKFESKPNWFFYKGYFARISGRAPNNKVEIFAHTGPIGDGGTGPNGDFDRTTDDELQAELLRQLTDVKVVIVR